MRPRRDPADRSPEVTLITAAAPSLDDQHDARRRKYLIMMGIRAVCVVLAVIAATISLWFAAVFIVGAVVLPWCAVLIANDRPPKRASRFARYSAPSDVRALPPAPGGTDPVDTAEPD